MIAVNALQKIGVSNMEELKKCPFCGGEAMLKINYGFDEKVISSFCTARNAELQHEVAL